MTTLEVELALMQYFKFNKNLVVPNLTTLSNIFNFEVDMLMITDSGYASGVEIKVSKADLKNDLKKSQWQNLDGMYRGKSKYERWFSMFKYFYYCIPEFLVEDTIAQVPQWCGILKVVQGKYCKIVVERKPTVLFKNKWEDDTILKVAKLGAMRINSLKYRIFELNQHKT